MDNESHNEQPDLRSTFYFQLNRPSFDNPQEVYNEALEALEGYMEMDTLFGGALPLFHRLGLPLPKIPIIAGTLIDPEITENDAEYIIRVLVDTGSTDAYRSEIAASLERFPNLPPLKPQPLP